MQPPSTIAPPLSFLYTDIGRGHPFYLDGIIEAIARQGGGPTFEKRTVFELSRGLSGMAWRGVRQAYLKGSSGGVLGRFYASVRRNNDYNHTGLIGKLLGRDLIRFAREHVGPIVVAHPLLVGLLGRHARVIYQHGELTAPDEALVAGAEMVIVPNDAVAKRFLSAGYRKEQVFVSGLCVEPAIATQAETCFEQRMKRLRGYEPLTGLFLSSGAEPKAHLRHIVSSAASCFGEGFRCIALAKAGGRLEQVIKNDWAARGLIYHPLTSDGLWPKDLGRAALVTFRSRKEENELAARIFPEIDFLVAPSHERTNWAMGLGLPTFLLAPAVGPFAPLNRKLLVTNGVARVLDSDLTASRLADTVYALRTSGELEIMARAGWGRPISGFERIASFLAERFS